MGKFNELFEDKNKEFEIKTWQNSLGVQFEKPNAMLHIRQNKDVDVLELKDITLKFGDFTLFDKLNFKIEDFTHTGQFITIMGKSGSGKSCLSYLISGLSVPNSGERFIYGKPYTDKTFIPTIFQQYSSFEWMTVLENVELPMKMKGIDEKTRKEYAMRLIEAVGLKGHENKFAKTPPLSGGQLQRVALARAIATNSPIIVLDEYSSGLDVASKATMQEILYKIFQDKETDRTFILITHDISEALFLSQRIYIMDGKTHSFSKILDIDYGTNYRNREEILSSEKYKEYYKEIEKSLKE